MKQSGNGAQTLHEESPLTEPEKQEVERTLASILASPPFRTTRQCQDLLRYVVLRTLAGEDESLRERIIGTEVFGRRRDYDTGEDPVVRIRAADVRKRLAQYYQHSQLAEGEVRIDIPSGSYRASFERIRATSTAGLAAEPEELAEVESARPDPPAPALPAPPAPARRRSPLGWVIAACVLLLVLGVWARYGGRQFRSAPTAGDLFWAPVLSSPKPALIYIGSNAAYRFSESFLEKYRSTHHLANKGPEFFVQLTPDQTIRAGDLIPVRNSFITVGDVAASAEITSLLARHNKPYQLRFASDVSFGDLRNTPTVLVGGFNNNWTLEVTNGLRFELRNGTSIVDTQQKDRVWSTLRNEDGSASEDFAVISRLLVSKTGGAVIAAAGVGQYGTQAAGELLANPQRLADALSKVPSDWSSKNVQLVLHVTVVDSVPSSSDVLATYVW